MLCGSVNVRKPQSGMPALASCVLWLTACLATHPSKSSTAAAAHLTGSSYSSTTTGGPAPAVARHGFLNGFLITGTGKARSPQLPCTCVLQLPVGTLSAPLPLARSAGAARLACLPAPAPAWPQAGHPRKCRACVCGSSSPPALWLLASRIPTSGNQLHVSVGAETALLVHCMCLLVKPLLADTGPRPAAAPQCLSHVRVPDPCRPAAHRPAATSPIPYPRHAWSTSSPSCCCCGAFLPIHHLSEVS